MNDEDDEESEKTIQSDAPSPRVTWVVSFLYKLKFVPINELTIIWKTIYPKPHREQSEAMDGTTNPTITGQHHRPPSYKIIQKMLITQCGYNARTSTN